MKDIKSELEKAVKQADIVAEHVSMYTHSSLSDGMPDGEGYYLAHVIDDASRLRADTRDALGAYCVGSIHRALASVEETIAAAERIKEAATHISLHYDDGSAYGIDKWARLSGEAHDICNDLHDIEQRLYGSNAWSETLARDINLLDTAYKDLDTAPGEELIDPDIAEAIADAAYYAGLTLSAAQDAQDARNLMAAHYSPASTSKWREALAYADGCLPYTKMPAPTAR